MLPVQTRLSPNYNARPGLDTVDMLVLHYTGMRSADEALTRLCCHEAEVSAHYMVDEDGTIFQLVEEEYRAWHAGVSHWRGRDNINDVSIGVEIVNPGHEFGYRPFPEAQMQGVSALCRDILSRHDIPARNVIAHSDIAPERKEDPGELFDWAGLAAQGVGLWPVVEAGLSPADPEKLAAYGYAQPVTAKTITAFQRHFRPASLTGEWDEECGLLLAMLLKMI